MPRKRRKFKPGSFKGTVFIILVLVLLSALLGFGIYAVYLIVTNCFVYY